MDGRAEDRDKAMMEALKMRAVTALAVSLMLVLAMVPAPTIGQDDDDDGWEWAAGTSFWTGGRGGPVVFLSLTPPLFLSVTIDDLWGYGLLPWTEQTQMSWTLFMEAAERLPIDGDTLKAVALELDEAACFDHPLPGGMLTVDGPGQDEASHTQVKDITIAQGREARCDLPLCEEIPITDTAELEPCR